MLFEVITLEEMSVSRKEEKPRTEALGIPTLRNNGEEKKWEKEPKESNEWGVTIAQGRKHCEQKGASNCAEAGQERWGWDLAMSLATDNWQKQFQGGEGVESLIWVTIRENKHCEIKNRKNRNLLF